MFDATELFLEGEFLYSCSVLVIFSVVQHNTSTGMMACYYQVRPTALHVACKTMLQGELARFRSGDHGHYEMLPLVETKNGYQTIGVQLISILRCVWRSFSHLLSLVESDFNS